MTEEKVPEEDTTHETEAEPDDSGETVETAPEPPIAPDVPGQTIEPTSPAIITAVDDTPAPADPGLATESEEEALHRTFDEHANKRG